MVKHILAFVAVAVLAGSAGFVQASGGSNSGGGGGGGGGGGTGGGSTIRYAGYITNVVDAPEGVYITIGTSYYNTGVLLVTPDTKVVYADGSTQSATADDIDLGDYVEVNATSARVAAKVSIVIP
ncbi:MAG TPA: hypothetical protein VFW33_16790 [Gemmataceae bacterium]|nr:hypothetical protein [Gemmataceae bacterium]